MEQQLTSQEALINAPDCTRHSERLAQQKSATQKAGRLWPSTWETLQMPVLYSVKIIRWLRSSLQSGLAWTTTLPRLRALYATL
jgi:hypothetical protein